MSTTNGTPAQAPEVKPSRITIEFPKGPGTSAMGIIPENIDSGQVYAAATLMQLFAEQVRGQELAEEARRAAVLPGSPNVLPPELQAIADAVRRGH